MVNQVEQFDVAIIGHGPVGCALANMLGQFAISTIILDKEASGYRLPRACSFDDEVMRVFQTMGLAGRVCEIAEVGGSAHFVDSGGKALVTWLRPKSLSPNNWSVNYRFHQPDLENILREGLKRYVCVTTRWGSDVTGLTQDEYGTTLRYNKIASDEQCELRATYVVGCDGAHSFTRSCMNSGIEDLGFRESWLIIDLLLKTAETEPTGETLHYCEEARSGSSVFVGSKRKRWEFRLKPSDNREEIRKPKNVWQLIERWIGPDQADLERTAIYTFHSTIAEKWRQGRLFIAGDAAHQTPPFMGQGMCAGIRDAANLGWKLERVLKQSAPATLLDTYQSERRPHVKAFIELTIQMGQMINQTTSAIIAGNVTDPADGPQKLTTLKPTLGPGLSGGQTKWHGHLFPQPRLQSGELLDDKIGTRPALILRPEFRRHLSAESDNNINTRKFAVIDDASTGLQDWFDSTAVNAVLIRPDRYIFGTASSDSEVQELLRFV